MLLVNQRDQLLPTSLVNILREPYFRKLVNSDIFELLNGNAIEVRKSSQAFLTSRFNMICFVRYANIRMLPSLSSLLLNFLTLSVSIRPQLRTYSHSSTLTLPTPLPTSDYENDHWSITAPSKLDRCQNINHKVSIRSFQSAHSLLLVTAHRSSTCIDFRPEHIGSTSSTKHLGKSASCIARIRTGS